MALFKKKSKGPEQGSIEAAMSNSGDAGPTAPDEGYPQPYLPSLSLVPDSRLTLLKRRAATRRAVLIGGLTAGALAAVLVGLTVTLFATKAAEKNAVAQREIVAEDVSALLPVRDLYDGFEARQTAVANALASDVDYYELVTEIEDAFQAEIPREALMQDEAGEWYVKADYEGIGLSNYTVSTTPCPSDEPFQPEPALGCVQGSGVASSYAVAGEAITALNNADNGLFGGYITDAADDKPVGSVGRTVFSFSVNFGAGALSGKYAEESQAILGTEPLLDSEAATDPSAAPSAAPSTEPTTATEGGN